MLNLREQLEINQNKDKTDKNIINLTLKKKNNNNNRYQEIHHESYKKNK